jgi:hypothetical protein
VVSNWSIAKLPFLIAQSAPTQADSIVPPVGGRQ